MYTLVQRYRPCSLVKPFVSRRLPCVADVDHGMAAKVHLVFGKVVHSIHFYRTNLSKFILAPSFYPYPGICL